MRRSFYHGDHGIERRIGASLIRHPVTKSAGYAYANPPYSFVTEFRSMPTAPLELTFRYLPGEYLSGIRAHQFPRYRVLTDFGVSALVLGVGVATLVGSEEFWLGVILIILALVVPTIYLVSLLVTPLMLGDNVKLEREYRLTLSDAGIHFRTESIDSRIAWSLYRRARRTANFYLLYYGRNQYTVIPRRVFADGSEAQAFEELLRRQLAKVDLA
jgi:hypothetical protein